MHERPLPALGGPMTPRRGQGGTMLALVLVIAATGCVGPSAGGRSSGNASSRGGASAAPAMTAAPTASAIAAPTGAPGIDAPPEALLMAEGGDPVRGQLGTYTWHDGGSDAPWLPGAPITVGPGEPLAVALQPPGDVASWRARYVPAGAGGPEAAVPLGGGGDGPWFLAPPVGAWTVEVRVVFPAGDGSAAYFWRVTVR
jgi:hypothetical protein